MTNEERNKTIRILQRLHDNNFLFASTEEDVKYATKLAIQELSQEPKVEKVIKMRDATPEERESIGKFIKNISKPTGVDFGDLEQEPSDDLIYRQDDRGISLKSVKHVLYDVCLHEDNMALFSKLLDRVNKLRDWEEYMAIKKQSSSDLISRQAVLETLDDMDNVLDEDRTIENYKELLKECYEVLPPVNPQPTGHWIRLNDYTDEKDEHKCSNCGFESMGATRFCPDCGRKMFKTGYWLFYGRLLKCSNCGYINDDILDFCPNCDAMMIEE